ncbi:binding-protein-dependent transport systems inner membrane component [Pyrobaculum islandicum DSM 4184]|uniref:Binding-protein-dependent transport systems inner membrane component n=1 Tax=Pyrobaculum islandicum (strain DSM 4184 / JCM 9189 / GEO3) TaxID=384616 RepID=A1RTZ2_PYRIL|nr:ABC transporter permease subunit [Pyrobaculum islandicum]ABL88424.1 binding-protein-dependent transport systems inner membrane component [Pyrobaculum islandicum DSM 4184]
MESIAIAVLALLATFGRMALALLSTVAIAYALAYAMYKSRRVEAVLLPLLDVLQSVPILGFFPIALYVFVFIMPQIGAELAAQFLIFTSMAWNIIFGIYQSFKTLPRELIEMSQVYLTERLALAHVFLPVALRSVYYNAAVSWSNAFFFITASEVITLGTEVKLFGIGSFVVDAFEKGDTTAAYVGIAIGTAGNIALYLFLWRRLIREMPQPPYVLSKILSVWMKYGIYVIFTATMLLSAVSIYYILRNFTPASQQWELLSYLVNSLIDVLPTLARVVMTLTISALAGLLSVALVVKNPQLETTVFIALSILSSIPAVFLYPLIGSVVRGEALSVALLLPGSIVYTVLNAVAAWRDVPKDLARAYGIGGAVYFIHILIPATLPYLITGLLTAWGGAWNATIVAESLANVNGLGAYMAQVAQLGNIPALIISVIVMSGVVITVNKLVWKRLYNLVAQWHS